MSQVWWYVESILPLVMLALIIAMLYAVVRYRHHRRVQPPPISIALTLGDSVVVVNLLLAGVLTLTPGFVYPGDPTRILNLVPFKEWVDLLKWSPGTSVVEVFGNVGLFVPAAVALSFRHTWPPGRLVKASFCAALSIEVAQYVFALGRVASVTDVISPVLGVGLSAVVCRRLLRHVSSRPEGHAVGHQ